MLSEAKHLFLLHKQILHVVQDDIFNCRSNIQPASGLDKPPQGFTNEQNRLDPITRFCPRSGLLRDLAAFRGQHGRFLFHLPLPDGGLFVRAQISALENIKVQSSVGRLKKPEHQKGG
jgi:hypothetical protein